jgi:hypothetical protein
VAKRKAGATPPKPPQDRTLSRAAERNYRVHALLGMAVKQGFGPKDLMDVAIRGWRVSPAVASKLVGEAYELAVTSTSLYDKLRMASIQLCRMEDLLKKAMASKQLGVALGVNREINQLILTVEKFEKALEEVGDGGAGAEPLTPEEQEAEDRAGDF